MRNVPRDAARMQVAVASWHVLSHGWVEDCREVEQYRMMIATNEADAVVGIAAALIAGALNALAVDVSSVEAMILLIV